MSLFLTLEDVDCCLKKLAAKVTALEGRVAALEGVTADPGAAPPAPGATGEVTLVDGAAYVADPAVTADSTVLFNVSTPGGVTGEVSYSVNPGAGINFMSDSIEDTSTISYSVQY